MGDFDGLTGAHSRIADAALSGDRGLSTALEHKMRGNEYSALRHGGTHVGHSWRAHTPEEGGEKNERMLVSGAWAIWHMVPAWRVKPGLRKITMRATLLVTNRRGVLDPADVVIAMELEGFGRVETTLTGDVDTADFAEVKLELDLGRAVTADVRVPLLLWIRCGLDDVAGGYILSTTEDRILEETPDNWVVDGPDFGPYAQASGRTDPIPIDLVADEEMLGRSSGLDGMAGGYGYYATLRRRAMTLRAEYEPVGGAWAVYDQAIIAAGRGVLAGDVRAHIVNARAAWNRPRALSVGARALYLDGDETQWRPIAPGDGGDLYSEGVWLDREAGVLEVVLALVVAYDYGAVTLSEEEFVAERARLLAALSVSLEGLTDGDTGWATASLAPATGQDLQAELVVYPTDLAAHAPPVLRALSGRLDRPPSPWTTSWRDGLLYGRDLDAVQYVAARIPYSGATVDQPYRVRVRVTSETTIDPPPGRLISTDNTWCVTVGAVVWDEGDVDAITGYEVPRLSDVRRGEPIRAEDLERAARLVDAVYQRRGQLGPCVVYDDVGNGFIRTSESYGVDRATGGPGLEVHEWLWHSPRVDDAGDARLTCYGYLRNADVRFTATPIGGGAATQGVVSESSGSAYVADTVELTLTADTTYLITMEMRRATGAGQGEVYALGIRDSILANGDTP